MHDGFARIGGGYCILADYRGENCGDATHPVVDIVDGGSGSRGN